jgi:hypothetical protein
MVAYALSRPPEPTAAAADHAAAAATTMEDNPIDFQAMATKQKSCAETQKLISGPTALTISFQTVGSHRLASDTSTGVWRPLVPLGHRRAVFNSIHNIAHPADWPQNDFCVPGLSRQESTETSSLGPRTAQSASSPKFTGMFMSNPSHSRFHNAGLPTSTSTWWDR